MKTVKMIFQYSIILLMVGLVLQCGKKKEECLEVPCITQKAKIGMSKKDFEKAFGKPERTVENKQEIWKDLEDLKAGYDSFIKSYGSSSSDGRIESSLAHINKALHNNRGNFKKQIYNIKVKHDGNEFIKSVYFYNNQLIAF